MAPSTTILNYRNNVGCITIEFLLFQIRIPVEKAADVFFSLFYFTWTITYKIYQDRCKMDFIVFRESCWINSYSIFNLQPRRYFRLQACSRKRWWELLLLGQERSWHKRWAFSDLWCLVSSPDCHHRWDQNYFLRGNWGRGSDQNLLKCVGEHPCTVGSPLSPALN